MSTVAPYTYDRTGAVAVCADGPELICYSGANDAPIWKQFVDGILVGVATTSTEVVSCDTDGHLIWWRKLDGSKMRESDLDMPVNALVTGPNDTVCAVGPKGVALITSKGDFNILEYDGTVSAAFGPPNILAIAFDNGAIEVRDIESGNEVGTIEVDAKIHSAAWSNLGFFLFTAGSQLHLVNQQDVPAPPPPPDIDPKDYKPPPADKRWALAQSIELGGPTTHVTASNDGILASVVVSALEVNVLELHNKALVGKVTMGREVTGLCFGQQNWLGIGLDDAGCNRVDLITGKTTKAQPGLGRMPAPTGIQVAINHMSVRGALASSKAGGEAIAVQTEWGSGLMDALPGTGAAADAGGGWCAPMAVGCVVLSSSCCCCNTFIYLMVSYT